MNVYVLYNAVLMFYEWYEMVIETQYL